MEFEGRIAAAEPADDEIDRQWVRARAARALFAGVAARASAPAARVGRFELGDRLGVGGMGVVYASHDPELGRDVAVKLIRVDLARDRAETRAEAQALGRLNHPNVVSVHDVGVVGDQVYIVMEFVRGQTLRAFATEPGRTWREVVDVYRQACAGLGAAHGAGLIHRDIKPDNAIVGDDGRVRLIDFGLAHERDRAARRPAAGTPRYMAPEQARGEPLTAAADQYALCASLREALEEVCGDKVPPWLDAIARRGTAPEPADRFPGIEALERALANDPRRVRQRRIAGAAVVVAVFGAFAIGALAAGDSELEACSGGPSLIGDAWAADEREQTLARIASASDYGASLADHVRPRADAFAARWANAHEAVCLAHARGERSEALFDRQVACLARGRRAFAATGALASDTDVDAVAGLAVAVETLPAPEACADITGVAVVDPPAPELAAAVADDHGVLEAVKVALAAGRFDAARDQAAAAITRARGLGYGPLLAEALLLEGRALLLLGRHDDAAPPLAEATRLALSVGADALAIEAWARRAWARGTSGRGDANDALAGLDVVEALSARVGSDTFATGLLYNNVGSLHIARGDRAAARIALGQAVAISRRVRGPGALELVNARGNLAIVTTDPAERDALAAEAVGEFAERVGERHPHTLLARFNRALVARDAASVRALLASTCDQLERLHAHLRQNAAECRYEQAWASVAEGGARDEAARAMGRAAELAPDDEAARQVAIAAAFAGSREPVLRLLAEAAPAGDAPWWLRLYRAELELAAAVTAAAPERRSLAAAAEARIGSIEDPIPLVARRLRLARALQ